MTTLLLRLSAPMQAWGTQSNFTHRDTGQEPSKSGVVGLLCSALGLPRSADVSTLSALRMAVRVEREGMVRRDYHTAGMGGVYKVSGGVKRQLVPSNRYYLADAKFLVGLEGDYNTLEPVFRALQHPTWLLFLGRKAFIPSERVWLPDGLQESSLEDVLTTYPWLGRGTPPEQLRVVFDDMNGEAVRNDYVLSFEPRRFVPRRVTTAFIPTPLSVTEV
jgi:CRISPR system Cascade subunit CasD